MAGTEVNRSCFAFAGGNPFLGGLEAMVHGITQDVDQGVGDGFNDGLVDLCPFSGQFQVHFFTRLD